MFRITFINQNNVRVTKLYPEYPVYWKTLCRMKHSSKVTVTAYGKA